MILKFHRYKQDWETHIDTEQNRKVLNFSVNCNVYVGWARKFFASIRMTLLRRESYKLFTNRLSYTWKWFLWKQLKSSQRRLMSHTLFFRVLVRVQLPTIQFHTEDFSSCFFRANVRLFKFVVFFRQSWINHCNYRAADGWSSPLRIFPSLSEMWRISRKEVMSRPSKSQFFVVIVSESNTTKTNKTKLISQSSRFHSHFTFCS